VQLVAHIVFFKQLRATRCLYDKQSTIYHGRIIVRLCATTAIASRCLGVSWDRQSRCFVTSFWLINSSWADRLRIAKQQVHSTDCRSLDNINAPGGGGEGGAVSRRLCNDHHNATIIPNSSLQFIRPVRPRLAAQFTQIVQQLFILLIYTQTIKTDSTASTRALSEVINSGNRLHLHGRSYVSGVSLLGSFVSGLYKNYLGNIFSQNSVERRHTHTGHGRKR